MEIIFILASFLGAENTKELKEAWDKLKEAI